MHTTETSPTTKLLRKPQVLERVGVSGSTLWRMQKRGQFPDSVQISPGTVGWFASDVEDWIVSRRASLETR
jgi:prophage regulatory protein